MKSASSVCIARYTFPMQTMFWLAVAVSAVVFVFIIRYVLRKISDKERASEARAAEFMAQLAARAPAPEAPPKATAPTPAGNRLETQKLLFDAARKAGDAGEPALSAQLYERLLARFPDSGFAAQVRAAAEAQKKKLNKT